MDVIVLLYGNHIEINGDHIGDVGDYNEHEITDLLRKVYKKGFEDGYEKHDMDCDDAYDKGFDDGFDDGEKHGKLHGYDL